MTLIDYVMGAGLVLIVVGVGTAYGPVGFIVGGLALVVLAGVGAS